MIDIERTRRVMENYDRNEQYRMQRMKEFTRWVNESLDRLTPAREDQCH